MVPVERLLFAVYQYRKQRRGVWFLCLQQNDLPAGMQAINMTKLEPGAVRDVYGLR